MPKVISDETYEQIKKLLQDGNSVLKIADDLGVSAQTIRNFIHGKSPSKILPPKGIKLKKGTRDKTRYSSILDKLIFLQVNLQKSVENYIKTIESLGEGKLNVRDSLKEKSERAWRKPDHIYLKVLLPAIAKLKQNSPFYDGDHKVSWELNPEGFYTIVIPHKEAFTFPFRECTKIEVFLPGELKND